MIIIMIIIIIMMIMIIIIVISQSKHSQIQDLIFAVALRFKDYTFLCFRQIVLQSIVSLTIRVCIVNG